MEETENSWQAPRHPDPKAIWHEAKADRCAGRYELAHRKLEWFYRNGAVLNPALDALRLSFVLREWRELGSEYPLAILKIREVRDSVIHDLAIADSSTSFGLFQELVALNRCLGENEDTLARFYRLEETDPLLAQVVFPTVRQMLLERAEFNRCLKYTDIESLLSTHFRNLAEFRAIAQRQQSPDQYLKGLEEYLMSKFGEAVALLVLCGRQSDAASVVERIQREWDSVALNTILMDALQGILPNT